MRCAVGSGLSDETWAVTAARGDSSGGCMVRELSSGLSSGLGAGEGGEAAGSWCGPHFLSSTWTEKISLSVIHNFDECPV